MTLRDLFTTGKILEIELSDLAPIADLLLAAVLGIIAAGVAMLQWRTHQRRVNSEERDRRVQRQYELFERRWKIYAAVRDCLDVMSDGVTSPLFRQAYEMSKGDPALRQADAATKGLSIMVLAKVLAQQNFRPLMVEAHFLFEQDVNEYLEELNNHCNALIEIERKREQVEIERKREQDPGAKFATTPERIDETIWFSQQDPIVKQKFEGYLRTEVTPPRGAARNPVFPGVFRGINPLSRRTFAPRAGSNHLRPGSVAGRVATARPRADRRSA